MQRLGRYDLIEPLGDDPPWRLYRARATALGGPYRHLDKEVVIRRLTYEPYDDAGWVQLEDAHLALELEHPNIERVLEWDHRELYCITELVEGWRLDRLLDVYSPLPWEAASSIVRQLCDAYRYIQERAEGEPSLGVVPRKPIKPGLVVITKEYEVSVRNPAFSFLDRSQPALVSLSPPKDLAYLAPEEVISLRADNRSDVYHLGLLLYELLTGKRPFSRGSAFRTIEAVRDDLPVKPSEAMAELPTRLDTVVVKALSKNPRHRQQTAGELASELDDLHQTFGVSLGPRPIRAYLERTGLSVSPTPYGLG